MRLAGRGSRIRAERLQEVSPSLHPPIGHGGINARPKMLECRRREEPHPDLARERAGCQEMVGGLIVLIAKHADNMRLESMAFPAFNGPQTAVEREPEEELYLWQHGGPPDEYGSRQRSHAKEECSIRRGGGVVSAWCPLPDVVVGDLWR